MVDMGIFYQVTKRWQEWERSTPRSFHGGKSDQIVLIDMGHGGINKNGKYVTAPSKMHEHADFTFYEGVWNRAVGWTLARMLGKAQRNYAVLTPGFYDISISARVGNLASLGGALNNGDMKPYSLSIHANAFGMESANGVEVYTSPGQTVSDPLATEYLNQFKDLGWRMREDLSDGDPDKEARFVMLTRPEDHGIPAILTETGFFTNEEQAREMCDLKTINRIAELMLQADVQIDYKDLL